MKLLPWTERKLIEYKPEKPVTFFEIPEGGTVVKIIPPSKDHYRLFPKWEPIQHAAKKFPIPCNPAGCPICEAIHRANKEKQNETMGL